MYQEQTRFLRERTSWEAEFLSCLGNATSDHPATSFVPLDTHNDDESACQLDQTGHRTKPPGGKPECAESLCKKCKTLNLTTLGGRVEPNEPISLGPFSETIDQTACTFCRIARHTVELHDSHPTQILSVSDGRRGFEVERYAEACELKKYRFRNHMDSGRLSHCANDKARDLAVGLYGAYTPRQAARRARRWLVDCRTSHGDECRSTAESTDDSSSRHNRSFTRIIDVYKRRVVRKKQLSAVATSKPYFALSYVNGSAAFLTLTPDNEFNLGSTGALSRIRLPQTFDDAILFTRRCKVQFLWIDALCILQGDEQEKEEESQINKMGHIYQQASLVLTAVLGSTPHFGLYPRRFHNSPIRGVKLVGVTCYGLRRNTCHTRAWCFQEQYMARRTVEFRAKGLHFRCTMEERRTQSQVSLEGPGPLCPNDELEDDRPPLRSVLQTFGQGYRQWLDARTKYFGPNFIYIWDMLVSDYMTRSLTYSGDVLRAFEGISASLAKATDDPVFFGMPAFLFSFCLFWSPGEPSRIRPSQGTIPSWSWASVGIPVKLVRNSIMPILNFHRSFSMVRYVLVGTAAGDMAHGVKTRHDRRHIAIDTARAWNLAENAIHVRPTPCVASSRCQQGHGTLHFVAFTIETKNFVIASSPDLTRPTCMHLLIRNNSHATDTRRSMISRIRFKSKTVEGFVSGVDSDRNPFLESSALAQSNTILRFFVAMALLPSCRVGDIDFKDYILPGCFRGDYYLSLLVSKEQGDITYERIGLAVVKRSVFEANGPEQTLIHLV